MIVDATLDDASAARTPVAHAAAHQNGGADEIATAAPAANAIPKAGGTGALDSGWIPDGAPTTAIGTDTVNAGGAATDFALSDHSHEVKVPNQTATATADSTTGSGVDVLMAGMSITPGAGTYLAIFTGSLDHGTNNASIEVSIYANAVQDADSERRFTRGTVAGNVTAGFPSVAIVTVAGGQSIEGRWRTSGGTATVHERSLILGRLD